MTKPLWQPYLLCDFRYTIAERVFPLEEVRSKCIHHNQRVQVTLTVQYACKPTVYSVPASITVTIDTSNLVCMSVRQLEQSVDIFPPQVTDIHTAQWMGVKAGGQDAFQQVMVRPERVGDNREIT